MAYLYPLKNESIVSYTTLFEGTTITPLRVDYIPDGVFVSVYKVAFHWHSYNEKKKNVKI